MDPKRRTLLTTGAAAAAVAAAPHAFAQQTQKGGTTMPFYQKGDVRIAYEEAGSGFPLLIISGGGLNSTITWGLKSAPFNAVEAFKDEYRCIITDLRNAHGGQSTGPLEVDRPWDSYIDDLLGLMDHLKIKRFMALGYCIGAPYIWGLIKRAPDRIVAAAPLQPVGWNKAHPTYMYDLSMKSWAPELMKRDPKIMPDMIEKFLTRMFPNPDFLFTVNREFVSKCQTPVLVLLDDTPGHPYDVALETVMLAPKSEVGLYPWKDPKERIPIAVRQVRSFLRAHRPAKA
jgi:pimeloyl-ACP methyl ester carboxylesterase